MMRVVIPWLTVFAVAQSPRNPEINAAFELCGDDNVELSAKSSSGLLEFFVIVKDENGGLGGGLFKADSGDNATLTCSKILAGESVALWRVTLGFTPVLQSGRFKVLLEQARDGQVNAAGRFYLQM